ncbi:hypothetical protein BH23CHL4_BH23CHL4_16830 [soil metagenome]
MTSLQAVRESQQLSIDELAALARVDAQTITMIESGEERASFSTAMKLARALNVDVNSILEFRTSFGGPLGPSLQPLLGPKVSH